MGRPRIYDSVEDMQEAIDKFFQECKDEEIPPTIQGLALALGYNSRQSLLNYEGYNEGEFLDTIKKARLKVENAKVIGGMTGKLNPAIVIFDLKNNHDHKDKTEQEITGKMELNKKPSWFDDGIENKTA
jgi:hypothetical protein